MADFREYIGMDASTFLVHYGVGHLQGGHSGRYPYGSTNNVKGGSSESAKKKTINDLKSLSDKQLKSDLKKYYDFDQGTALFPKGSKSEEEYNKALRKVKETVEEEIVSLFDDQHKKRYKELYSSEMKNDLEKNKEHADEEYIKALNSCDAARRVVNEIEKANPLNNGKKPWDDGYHSFEEDNDVRYADQIFDDIVVNGDLYYYDWMTTGLLKDMGYEPTDEAIEYLRDKLTDMYYDK